VERVIRAGLALSGEVEAGEELWRPIEGLAPGELVGIEGSERQMEGAQVVVGVDVSEEAGSDQRR